MRVGYFYELMNRPVFVTEKLWYEIMSGPFELEDDSFLYLARPTGKMLPPEEFVERRYYIRVARAGKELIRLGEARMEDKLQFRKVDMIRIADRVHDIGNSASMRYLFGDQPTYKLKDYQFSVAKIHNKKDWMKEPMMPELADIAAGNIKLVDMKLSVNGFKYLKKAKVENLKELVSLTPIELEEICHGNKTVIQEFENVAAKFGVYFVKLP